MAGSVQDEEKEKNVAGLSRNVFFLGLVSFFNDLSSEMVYPLFPTFLTEFLGAGAWFLGLAEGLADTVASLLNLVSGWISDRFRKRKGLVVSGYGLSALSRGSLALVVAPWQALLGWFFNRVGKGMRTAPRDALIADSCHPRQKGRAFGYQRSMDHSGALLGAALSSILLAALSLGYRAVFALALVPVALGILLLLWQVKERVDKCPSIEEAGLPRLDLRPFDRRFKRLLVAVFVFTLGNSSDAFLLLWARQVVGFPLVLLPALWGVLHVVKAGVSIPGGALSDRLGRRRVIFLGWAVYFLSYSGFALLRGVIWTWLLFPFYGIYYLTEGVLKAFVADIVSPRLRGSAYGIYNFTVGVTVLPASLFMGLLWSTVGARTAFLTGAGLALVASFILATVPRRGEGHQ
ncbi:MAG: MFS transporter [Actinomycetota bacterium]